ncbi:MAG: serine/threonine protein kinase, partial [Chroococcidiopsis sp.]
MPYQPSVTLCINPSDPQHPHVQAGGNKFCTTCGAPIALRERYIPLKKLGTGGFSVIYTIWDLQTQTERVLKILLENGAKARQLFQQEAAILTSLNHPGVPRVEPDGYFHLPASNSKRDLFCLVMEKIDGQTLEA